MSLNKILCSLNHYKFSILSVILLCILGYKLNGQISFIFINIASIFLLTNILAKTFKYTFLLSILFVLFITADVVYYLMYSSSIYLGILSSILETNPAEAREMFGELKIYIIGSFIGVIALYSLSTFELRKKGLNLKVSLSLFFIINLILIPTYLFMNHKRDRSEMGQALYRDNFPTWIQNTISSKFPIVYNDVATLSIYIKDRYRIKKLLNTKRELPEDLSKPEQENEISRIYLIIGESSFREHYSLYGYDVKTTPFLEHLRDSVKNIHYYKAISPGCITRDAIRMSLSFATPQNQDLFFTQKNIIDLAKDQGYETVWISNHERVDSQDYNTGVLASSSDIVFFQTLHGTLRNDLGLIDKLNELSTPNKKQLIVIHIQGSHIPYEYRHDELDVAAIPQTQTVHITNYDRSIHYTDRVLEKIYNYTKTNDAKSIIYYFSDHGECVGIGHGMLDGGKDQYQIPLLLIDNNSEIPIDSIVDKYKDPKSGLFNNTNSIYVMSEILGYKVNKKAIQSAKDNSKYVFHIDGKIHQYEDITKK